MTRSTQEELTALLCELVIDAPLNECADEGISCLHCCGKLNYVRDSSFFGGSYVFQHEPSCVFIRARKALNMSIDNLVME